MAEVIFSKTQTTGISWTQHTWNPFVGCMIHTAGCTNCYAMKQAGFIASQNPKSHYVGVIKQVGKGVRDVVWSGELHRSPEHIMQKPRKIREPAMIFVNSMSDFFHDKADPAWQYDAMKVMAGTPHFYQILTKRPENIGKCLSANGLFPPNVMVGATMERHDYRHRIAILEDYKRGGLLLHTFLSIEPLVGPPGELNLWGIDWVIVGGESGPNSRLMDYSWLLSVRNQALEQNVPLFFKQYGILENNPLFYMEKDPTAGAFAVAKHDKVGKGGSKIQGVSYKQFPKCIEDWRRAHALEPAL
jgi:protein gp37